MVVWIQNPFDNLQGEGFRKMRYALMADAFVRAGHRVVIWTSDFSHATKCSRTLRRTSDSSSSCMSIQMVRTIPYARNVSLRRVVSHIAYARQWERDAAGVVADGLARPSLIVSSLPTISAAAAAIRIARRFGASVAVDVQDAWPETFERILPRWTLSPLRKMAQRVFREADIVTGVCSRYRELANRSDYVMAYLGIELGPRPALPCSNGPRRRIAYVGGLGCSYDLKTVRRAAEMLDMELAVAGGKNYLGQAELESFLSGCDVGVVPMSADSWVGLPNKLFDYAKAGLPIVSSLGGESAELIAKYACGATYKVGDVDSLSNAIRSALACEAGASRRMCEAEFDATRIYDSYVRTLESRI